MEKTGVDYRPLRNATVKRGLAQDRCLVTMDLGILLLQKEPKQLQRILHGQRRDR